MTTDGMASGPAGARLGILLIVVSVAFGALNGALMKLMATDLPPLQVSWFRFTGLFLLMLPLVVWRLGPAALLPRRPRVQVVRGICLAIGNVAFITGAVDLDYADAIAVLYAYPFMLTVAAVLVLDEKVSPIGWASVAGGFCGVLLVMRPDPMALDLAALLVLLSAMLVVVQMILNRRLGAVSDPMVISVWGALVAALVLTPTLPFVWQPVPSGQIPVLVLLIASGTLSHTLVIIAFTKAPASDLAPFTYGEIVCAVLIAYLLFGTMPDAVSWAGMALITISGLAIVRLRRDRSVPRRLPKV